MNTSPIIPQSPGSRDLDSSERLVAIAFNVRGSRDSERLLCAWSPVLMRKITACLQLAFRIHLGRTIEFGASGAPASGIITAPVHDHELASALKAVIETMELLGYIDAGIEVAAYDPVELVWRTHYPVGGTPPKPFDRWLTPAAMKEYESLDKAFQEEGKRILGRPYTE